MVSKGKEFKIAVTLDEIAKEVGGVIKGDPGKVVTNINTIQDADEGSITFLSNPRYGKYIQTTKAAAVIVDKDYNLPDKNFIIVENPYLAFAKILKKYFYVPHVPEGISSEAHVSTKAKIGANVTIGASTVVEEGAEIGDGTYIYPGVYVGKNVKIGKKCLIYPGVIIREDSILGNRVILQPGVVIGGDGFGFVPGEGGHFKIPQVGRVILKDDVEIGANTTVDRGALKDTVIGKGTKIDNLVQIGHNVVIGKYCLIAAQTGISGSVKIGDFVIIGGQVGIAGHIEIGDGVQIAAKSGVNVSVRDGEIVGGIPAVKHSDWLKITAVWKKLPVLWERMKKLEGK